MTGLAPAVADTPVVPLDDIDWALAEIRSSERQKRYQLYGDYYDGKQRLLFATRKYRRVFNRVFRSEDMLRQLGFVDNLCATVVDAAVERLRVTGFHFEAGRSSERLARDAWAIWERNVMDVRADEVHRDAFKVGDGYAIVWPNRDGDAVVWRQRPEQMAVEYDEEDPGVVVRAAKLWHARDRRVRLNLYYPDVIEKYESVKPAKTLRAKVDWQPVRSPRLSGAGELENPYGVVPVFHFPNKHLDEPGVSELQDVVPLQDALNKSELDMLVAMEFSAFRQRWGTGIEQEVDEETGEPVDPDFEHGADRLWLTANENAKFGDFAASDLTQFIEVAESFRSQIARVSGTPLHLLFITRGDFPSGEAMKSAEARFVRKLGNRQTSWGSRWEQAVAFAMTIDRAKPKQRATTLWETVSARSPRELLEDALLKKAIGVRIARILKELGYEDDEVSASLAELDSAADGADVDDESIILPTRSGRVRIPRAGRPPAQPPADRAGR